MPDDILLTPEQVAARLQISRITVMYYLREGKLRGTKVGRLWRVTDGDVQAFIQEHRPLLSRRTVKESL